MSGFWLAAGQALAQQPVTAHLDWTVPEDADCMTAAELKSRVHRRLERRVFAPARQPDLIVDANVRRLANADGWEAVVELRRADGTLHGIRELRTQSSDCRSLSGYVALVLAVMVDLPRPHASVRVEQKPEPWQLEGFVGASLERQWVPGWGLGVKVVGRLTPGAWWPVELRAGLWPGSRSNDSGPGARIGAWTVGAALCPSLFISQTLHLSACAGLGAGFLHADGVELDEPRSALEPVGMSEAGLAAVWQALEPVLIRLDVGVYVPFSRHRFVFSRADGSEVEVHRLPPVIPSGGLSVGLNFF